MINIVAYLFDIFQRLDLFWIIFNIQDLRHQSFLMIYVYFISKDLLLRINMFNQSMKLLRHLTTEQIATYLAGEHLL